MDSVKQTPKKSPYQIALDVNINFALVSMGLFLAVLIAVILGLHIIAILFVIPMTISLILTLVWDRKARKLQDG